MPKTVKEEDRVRIVSREATAEDAKTGLYYSFLGGLTGTVRKVYSPQEVAVDVEPESLTTEMRKRHEQVRQDMRSKWLDALSDSERSKLTEPERNFILRYIVLVGMHDLERVGGRAATTPAAVAAPTAPAPEAGPAPAAASPPPASTDVEPAPRRKTSAELEAAEQEELQRRAKQDE
jgi:hypothetical protein